MVITMEFTFKGKKLYYESYGEGSPLLLLNGIFMSCASWAALAPGLSNGIRLYLLDMFDQGKSDKMDEDYTQELQAELVIAFIEQVGHGCMNLLGISYGGEVAMKAAARRPELIPKLILSNTTAYTSPWLRDIGDSWEYSFRSYDGRQFFKTCIPSIYSPQFYEKNYAWASAREDMFVEMFTPDVYDAFGRLTRSAQYHDERENLHKITADTLIISSEFDFVTPSYQQRELAMAIPGAGHVVIQGSGHAVMYEKPVEFVSLVSGFINTNTKIKIV